MRDGQLHNVAAAALVVGAVLGMAGSFAPSAELRGLAWGADGIALVVGSALLGLHHLLRGDAQLAAGFLVFLAGETLILSGSAMDLAASAPSFAAGAGLWSAALALVSASPILPRLVRVTGAIAAILFAVTAARIFGGAGLTPLSEPLPFYGYPFLAATLFGWAWVHTRSSSRDLEVEHRRAECAMTSSPCCAASKRRERIMRHSFSIHLLKTGTYPDR